MIIGEHHKGSLAPMGAGVRGGGIYDLRPRGGEVPFVGPLDGYTNGLAAAWSLNRRLLSGYSGPLFRVIGASGGINGVGKDIGYNAAGEVDLAELAAFVGSETAYVSRINDQSGLGRYVIDSSSASRYIIVDEGSILKRNGRLVMRAPSSGRGYQTTAFAEYNGLKLTDLAYLYVPGFTDNGYLFGAASINNGVVPEQYAVRVEGVGAVQGVINTDDYAEIIGNGGASYYYLNINEERISIRNNEGDDQAPLTESNSLKIRQFLLSAYQRVNPQSIPGMEFMERFVWFDDMEANRAELVALMTDYYE